MKKTVNFLRILSIALICMAMVAGLLSFSVSAESVVTSVVIDGETLNETTPFLIDTGAGYVAGDDTLLDTYTWVAQFDPDAGVLTLRDYDGGAISTAATGDLTIKLMGENTIRHEEVGIDIFGGNLTITADAAATLNIQSIPSTSHADEASDYVGIDNNFENGYADAEASEGSGDSVTIMGYAAVSISSTKTYESGSVNGIGAYGSVMVLGNASLNITETNAYTNLARGIYSLGGAIVINTTGDVNIAVCGEASHNVGENVFRAASGAVLGRVGKMTLDWTYPEFFEESEIELDAELSSYVIGTIPEDDTSATYGYKFPITVTGGVAKMGDDVVEAAAKGEVITVVADAPEAGQGFYQWSILNEVEVTFADEKAASTTFEMIADAVELEALFTPAYTITANNATASVDSAVSGSVVTVTADAPQKGYQFAGWIVQSGGVVLSDPANSTTSFVMGDAAVEITATYEATLYLLTVNGGAASIDDAPVTEASIADTVTLVADTPAAGKVFKEWVIVSGEGTLTDPTASTTTLTGVFGDIEIEATYEDATYTITVDGGTASSETAKMGDEITITAESVAGKTFKSWTVSSGGVTLDSATSATTTFVVGTENVELVANYTFTDYSVSIKDGKGTVNYIDNGITDANVGDSIYIDADDPESGYAFIRWNVLSGEIELEDPTSSYTIFTMTAGNVELEAVYAEIVVLDKLEFTVTPPAVGAHPTFELVSKDPAKYGSEYVSISLNDSPYTELGAEDTYMLGHSYCLEFQLVLANGYEIDGNTKVYVNGEETYRSLPLWFYYFEFPVSITVINGKAYEDSGRTVEITEGLSQYVYLKADEVPEGKVFLGWIVKSGDITIYSPDREDSANFNLKNEPVTVEAVIADVLEEVVLTVTTPKPGDLATIEITSADPSKYTAELIDFYINKSPYTQLTPTDPFEYGRSYTMQFEIIAAEGYAVTEDTVVTVNGDETYGYDGDITGYEKQRWSFELPVSITVINGKAYTSSEHTEEVEVFYNGNNLFIKADEAPEGKEFLMWKITTDGDITYKHRDPTDIWVGSASVIVCEAIYAIPINEIELTMPQITVGSTPITTVTTESDLYTVEIETWYHLDKDNNRTEMLPTDTYEANERYECRYIITPKDGYRVGEYAEFSVNGKVGSIAGYISGTAIVGAYVQLNDLLLVGIDVTGGKLYLDGVETNETEFLPGTTLTLVADKSLYPEGETFTRWNILYYSYLLEYIDERAESFTFTVCEPYSYDYTISIEAQYAALTSVYYLYTYVPHPVVGGTPSYDAGVDKWKDYFGEVLAWYEGETLLEADHVFEAGKTYTVKIRLEPAPGYYFPPLDFSSLCADNTFSGNSADGIFLERGENGEYIIFESSITAKQFQENMSVTVTTPVAGMLPSDVVEKDGEVNCDVEFGGWLYWDEENSKYIELAEGELFEVGKTYRVDVEFSSNDTCFIDYNNITVLINGKNPVRFSSGSKAGGLCTVGYYLEFTVEADGSTFDLEVENGSATIDEVPVTEVGGGITVTITADAPEAGKAFKGWSVVSGENVVFVDATASTTTFVMPAGNVSIQAVYRNTPHTITVEDGTADMSEAGDGETVTITADEAPDGKYFAGWECTAGGVNFADESAKTTTFVMTGEAVTVKALYADKILLDEMNFTIVAPANGENPSYVITSTDPEKYTAVVDYWHTNSTYENLTPESVFEYGQGYTLRFKMTAAEKYTFDNNTVVTLNGMYCGVYSSNGRQCATLNVLVPITVEGGHAIDGNGNLITGQLYDRYVELVGDDAPEEGQCFSHWEVVVGGITISYPSYQSGAYFVIGKEPVTVRAIYHTHTYNETYKNDNTYHWFACTDPDCPDPEDSVQSKVEHVWDNACDTACNTCGYVRTTYHNYYNNYFPQKDATCTETGMQAHYECTVCHTLFDTNMNVKTEQELSIAIDPNAHAWGDWASNGDGTHTRICSHNNAHTATADCEGGEATCTEKAICSTCSAAYGNALGHTYGEKVAKVDPTCVVGGVKAHYYCSACDTYFNEEKVETSYEQLLIPVDPTAHNWGAWNSNDDGTHTRICMHNGDHKETADCEGGEATCTERAVCTICNEGYGDLKPHSYSEATCTQKATCSVCGDVTGDLVPHSYSEATCIAKAKCSVCGAETGDFGAHDYGNLVEEVPATHTADVLSAGKKAYYQCSVCSKYFDANKNPVEEASLIIPAPTHTFGDWVKNDENHWKVCECGKKDGEAAHIYDDEADMLCNTCQYDRTAPHTHGNGIEVLGQAATCTVDGWKSYYQCSCGHIYTDKDCTNEITNLVAWKNGDGKIAALSHAFGDWVSNGNGTHTRTCTRDNGHTETADCAGGNATCTAKAICTTCKAAYGDLKPHSYSEATCTQKATCSVCGDVTGDLLPHSYSEATCTQKATCSVCGDVTGDLKPHSYSEATCIAKAKCSVCGAETGDFGAHDYGTLVEEVPATHTADVLSAGKKAYYQCSVCSKYFDANKNPVEEASLIIPAPTHTFGDWVKNDENHWKVCECGKKDGEAAHIYDDEADMLCNTCQYDRTAPHTHGNGIEVLGQAATCTVDGWKSYYQCSCGHIYTDKDCTNEITNLVAWKAAEGKIAAAHTLGDLISATEPNCTTEGMKAHYECEVCGVFFDEEKNVKAENELKIPVNDDHDFNAWATNGDGTHTRVCSRNAEHKETKACNGGEATCTQKAICDECNSFYGEMKEHTFSEATCAKRATCTACGTETGELMPHSYSEATCTAKAKCSVCGAETGDFAPHTYSEATCTAKAKCSVCGAETGDFAPHTYSEATCTAKAKCLVCGVETGDLADHVDANEDGKCDACEYQMTPGIPEESTPADPEQPTTPEPSTPEEPEEPKKGLSGGAIAGIVVGSTVVAGAGGFAIWWFALQKKTVAELGTACKSVGGKIGKTCKNAVEKIKALFNKKK